MKINREFVLVCFSVPLLLCFGILSFSLAAAVVLSIVVVLQQLQLGNGSAAANFVKYIRRKFHRRCVEHGNMGSTTGRIFASARKDEKIKYMVVVVAKCSSHTVVQITKVILYTILSSFD